MTAGDKYAQIEAARLKRTAPPVVVQPRRRAPPRQARPAPASKPLPPTTTAKRRSKVVTSYSGRTWGVVRINDDGRRLVVQRGMHPDAAAHEAGRLRDAMSDDDVGRGWNYLASKVSDLGDQLRRNGKADSVAQAETPADPTTESETAGIGDPPTVGVTGKRSSASRA